MVNAEDSIIGLILQLFVETILKTYLFKNVQADETGLRTFSVRERWGHVN